MSSSAIKKPKIAEVLELKHPVMQGHEEITKLEFETLKGRHMKGLPAFKVSNDESFELSFDFLYGLIRNLSNESELVIDELEGVDFFAAMEIVGRFLEHSPVNIKMPSVS